MDINTNSGDIITLDEAKQLTHSFQKRYPNEKKAFFVGKDKLQKILEQDGCIGFRIYNGYNDEESESNRVLVGVDEKGNDMIDGLILDRVIPCPPYCSGSGGL